MHVQGLDPALLIDLIAQQLSVDGQRNLQQTAQAKLGCVCPGNQQDAYSGARSFSPEQVVAGHQIITEQRIYSLDTKSRQDLCEANAKRGKDGKPPIDERQVLRTTGQVEQIMNDPNLKDKEKKKQVDELRKRIGFSKDEMSELVTGRVERTLKQGKDEIKQYRESRERELKGALEHAEKVYGKSSFEAQQIKEELKSNNSTLKEYEAHLGARAKSYEKVKKRGFWSKLGSALKTAGKLAMSYAKFIPVVGPFIDMGIRAAMAVYNISKYGWGEGLKRTLFREAGALAGGIGDKLGDAAGIAGHVGNAAEKIEKYGLPGYRTVNAAARGDVLGAVSQGAGLGASVTNGSAQDVLSDVKLGADTARRGEYVYRAARSGDVASAVAVSTQVSRDVGTLTGWDTTRVTRELDVQTERVQLAQALYNDPITTSASIMYARLAKYDDKKR